MKVGISSLVLGLFWVGMAGAQPGPDPNDPEVLLKNKLAAVVRILADDEQDLATKETRINNLLQPIFDFELMSYLTLGKTQWSKMTPPERKRFVELFVARLKDSYRDKLSMYSGEKIVYKPPLRAGTKIQIPTEVVSQEQPVSVIYKMHVNPKRKKGWRIYDVEVQGVSLIKTYRSQFGEVLSKGSIEDLLQKLEEPVGEEVPAQP